MTPARALFRSADVGAGVRLHLRRTSAFKTISARLVLHSNLDAETAARALIPRVLGRGTRRLPSLREWQVELDRLYGASLHGDTRKLGDRHFVQIRSDWIMDRLAGEPLFEAMGRLWAEFLHEPALDASGGFRTEVVEHERKMLADEAAAVIDDKARYARHRLVEEMCSGEAYARPATGRLEEIRAVDPVQVKRAYDELIGRAPADLFLVGDVTWSKARGFVRALGFDPRRRPARLFATRRKRPARVRTVREREHLAQAKLAMGFRTSVRYGTKLQAPLSLMNAIFGGTPVSLLFKVVREQESLCYSIGSVLERTKGLLVVQAGIEAGDYARARRYVLRELRRIQRGEIPAETFRQAKGVLLSGLRSLRDAPAGMIDFALEHVANGKEANLDATLAALAAVSVRDVARAASTVSLDTVYLLGG